PSVQAGSLFLVVLVVILRFGLLPGAGGGRLGVGRVHRLTKGTILHLIVNGRLSVRVGVHAVRRELVQNLGRLDHLMQQGNGLVIRLGVGGLKGLDELLVLLETVQHSHHLLLQVFPVAALHSVAYDALDRVHGIIGHLVWRRWVVLAQL